LQQCGPTPALSVSSVMRGETLIQQHPPTPPSTGGEYQAGLQHIAHYNTGRGYAYASPRSIGHEGIPSHGSHVVSHPGEERLGLGIQYVRASMMFASHSHADSLAGRLRPRRRILPHRTVQRITSEWVPWHALSVKTDLCRTSSRYSRHQPQGPRSMMILNEDPPAMHVTLQRPVRRDERKQVLDQKRFPSRKSQRPRRETSQSLRN
jgi:hypothetical protein